MASEQTSAGGQMVLSTAENSHKRSLLLEVIKTASHLPRFRGCITSGRNPLPACCPHCIPFALALTLPENLGMREASTSSPPSPTQHLHSQQLICLRFVLTCLAWPDTGIKLSMTRQSPLEEQPHCWLGFLPSAPIASPSSLPTFLLDFCFAFIF